MKRFSSRPGKTSKVNCDCCERRFRGFLHVLCRRLIDRLVITVSLIVEIAGMFGPEHRACVEVSLLWR